MTARKNGRKAERRRTTRADARLSMRLEPNAPEADGIQLVTESQNISASGVYCMSSHYLAPLSKVDLTIVLPRVPGGRSPKELIKCEGIVVRCEQSVRRTEKPFELACMFSGLADEVRRRIDSFVTWRNLQALRAATRGPARASRTRTARGPAKPSKRVASSSRGGKTARRTVH